MGETGSNFTDLDRVPELKSHKMLNVTRKPLHAHDKEVGDIGSSCLMPLEGLRELVFLSLTRI